MKEMSSSLYSYHFFLEALNSSLSSSSSKIHSKLSGTLATLVSKEH